MKARARLISFGMEKKILNYLNVRDLAIPRSLLTYSRGLRHLHLLMAIGIFGALGTAQAASYSEGQNKRTPQLEGMEGG